MPQWDGLDPAGPIWAAAIDPSHSVVLLYSFSDVLGCWRTVLMLKKALRHGE